MKKTFLYSLALACALLLASPSSAIRSQLVSRLDSQAAPASAPISIPFDLANRHIVLQGRVNDSPPLSFILDTGAKTGMISLDRAKELGLTFGRQIRVGGAGSGTSEGAMVRDAVLSIDGLPKFSQPITMALPFRNFSARMGRDFDGIVGGEFIGHFVVEIDYQAKKLKLHDKERFVYSGPGEAVPITINSHGHPVVEAEITPQGGTPLKGPFLFDIGSGGALVLHTPFVTEHELLNDKLKTIKLIGSAGAGGEVAGRIGRVAQLKIGQYKIAQPITIFSQDKAGAFSTSSQIGNIGAQIANKFRVFLDYKRGRIILEPNSTFANPFDRAFSGLALRAEGKDYRTFRISHVLEDSPASESGLQPDDVIAEIDGKPAGEFTLTKVNEMFEKDVSYNLTVKRGEKTLKVKLKPKKLI